MMNSTLFLALDATKNLKLSDENIEFWRSSRKFIQGGASIQGDLISKTITPAVNILLLVGIVCIAIMMFYQMSFKTVGGGPIEVLRQGFPQLLSVALVTLLLTNNYANAYKITEGTWTFRDFLRDNTQTSTMATQVITEAIANELFNAQYGQSVMDQFNKCEGLPYPTVKVPTAVRPPVSVGAEGASGVEVAQTYDYLECMDALQRKVKDNLKILQEDCGKNLQNCEVVKEKSDTLAKQVDAGVTKIKRNFALSDVGLPDIPLPKLGLPDLSRPQDIRTPATIITASDIAFLGDAINSAISGVGDFVYMELVELGNSLYTGFINISYMLATLIFPVTVAWSLIPGKRRVLADWAVFALSIIVSEQIYLVTVGMVAVLSRQAEFSEFGPRLFLITLGILGPLLSVGGGAVSGFTMAKTYRGASAAGAGAALSVATGAAFTIAYRLNSKRQTSR